MSNKTTTSIDIFDFISEDDLNFEENEDSEMVYIHAKELLEAVQSELENHPKYKDFNIEILGVSRWEY